MAFPVVGILFKFLNFKKFIPVIIQNWKAILIAGLLAIIGYQNIMETRIFFGANTLPYLEKRLIEMENAVDICVKGNVILGAAIDERNGEIAEWERISGERQTEIDKLQGRLDNIRKQTDKKAKDILNEPTPKTCEASIEYLRDGRKDLTW